MAINRYRLTSKVTIAWPSTWSEVSNGPSGPAVTTPAVPASTVQAPNPYDVPVQVAITGGTVTVVSVDGVTVASSSPATVVVPVGGEIAITYSAAPTWVWTGVPTAGATPQSVLVSNPAPAGGQLGTLPQTTWLQGMELLLDPSGPLYAAIGSGNLVQITAVDDVGHSGLSN